MDIDTEFQIFVKKDGKELLYMAKNNPKDAIAAAEMYVKYWGHSTYIIEVETVVTSALYWTSDD